MIPPCSSTLLAWPEGSDSESCIEAPAMPIRLPYQRKRDLLYAGSFLAKLRVRGGLGVYSATVAGSRWHPGCHSQWQHTWRISLRTPLEVQVASAGGVLLCVWVTASTSRFGGQVLALRVRGLCTFKSLVAGRAAVESSTSKSRVVAGVPQCLGSSSRHSRATARCF